MGTFTDLFNEAYRDFVTNGVPSSGANEPAKSDIRGIGAALDAALSAAIQGMKQFASVATAQADAATAPGTQAHIYLNNGSATDPANGVYVNPTGAVGGYVVDAAFYSQIATIVQPLVNEAKAWAQSPTSPDPGDPTAGSAKTWANTAQASAAAISKLTQFTLLAQTVETIRDQFMMSDLDGNAMLRLGVMGDLSAAGQVTGSNLAYALVAPGYTHHPMMLADWDGNVLAYLSADGTWVTGTAGDGGGGDGGTASAGPRIILDTDCDTDCDDEGDVMALIALERQGRARLAGIITNSANPYSAPAVKAVAVYMDRSDLTIGAYQASDVRNGDAVHGGSSIARSVATQFRPGETRSAYPASLDTYRALLEATPASDPVTIVATGYCSTLYELLTSPVDGEHLAGVDLIKTKVDRLIVSAGIFPNSAAFAAGGPGGYGNPEFNFATDATRWNYLVANWPGQIIFVGAEQGEPISTAPPITESTTTNPVRFAYQALMGNANRPSWSLPAIMAAVKDYSLVNMADRGTAAVSASDGSNTWTASSSGAHYYVAKVQNDLNLQQFWNLLLASKP